jgi:Lipid A 3-O-deacylase (PagL)
VDLRHHDSHDHVRLRELVPNASLDVEGGVQHISNGGLAGRNLGVNAFGGALGFTYYFPAGR